MTDVKVKLLPGDGGSTVTVTGVTLVIVGGGSTPTEIARVDTTYVVGTGGQAAGVNSWWGDNTDAHITTFVSPATRRVWIAPPYDPNQPDPATVFNSQWHDSTWTNRFMHANYEIDIYDFDVEGMVPIDLAAFEACLLNNYDGLRPDGSGRAIDGYLDSAAHDGQGCWADLIEGHTYVVGVVCYSAPGSVGQSLAIGNVLQRLARGVEVAITGEKYDIGPSGLVETEVPEIDVRTAAFSSDRFWGIPADPEELGQAAPQWLPAPSGGSGLPDGGTTGQYLGKASDADDDVSWQTPPGPDWESYTPEAEKVASGTTHVNLFGPVEYVQFDTLPDTWTDDAHEGHFSRTDPAGFYWVNASLKFDDAALAANPTVVSAGFVLAGRVTNRVAEVSGDIRQRQGLADLRGLVWSGLVFLPKHYDNEVADFCWYYLLRDSAGNGLTGIDIPITATYSYTRLV